MVFCNLEYIKEGEMPSKVTILILIDGFLQFIYLYDEEVYVDKVTILILIDGFLQSRREC